MAINAMVWKEVDSGGVNGSRALDGARATSDDSSFTYWRTPFDFDQQRQVLRISMMFKAKTNAQTMNSCIQMGFIAHTNVVNTNAAITTMSSTNTSFNNNPGVLFMSARINRTSGMRYNVSGSRDTGGKVAGGSFGITPG